MQIIRDNPTPTTTKLTITADETTLQEVKAAVLQRLSRDVKVPGFRDGKAPIELIEKNLNESLYQTEFLEQAVSRVYIDAVEQENLKPISQPNVEISKFVPFNTLEITVEVEVVGPIKLPDYKKIKQPLEPVKVTADDINAVLDDLKVRAAEKKDVDRAAKSGDEVTIDFAGRDAKTNEPIAGADGKSYPLILGSNSFIPGFEENVIGIKPGEEKEFTLTFPADYGVKALQKREVIFKITANKVTELVTPKLDDEFASKVGPFKSLAELKADIKKQVESDKQYQQERDYNNQLLEKIAEKTTLELPASMVEEAMDRMEDEEKRNIAYRGQTWQEHLAEEGLTAEQHREKQRAGAELRTKVSLILSEIAEKEKVTVTKEELDLRIQLLKGQYGDPSMQVELDKQENRRDIASRLVSEKTLEILRNYAAA
ncbi:MAG: Trigger factor [Candidatus Saccharibacteria bacterium]|nr:Trigger factor [Candidatus Saccharibacteria bacterium]